MGPFKGRSHYESQPLHMEPEAAETKLKILTSSRDNNNKIGNIKWNHFGLPPEPDELSMVQKIMLHRLTQEVRLKKGQIDDIGGFNLSFFMTFPVAFLQKMVIFTVFGAIFWPILKVKMIKTENTRK